MSNYRSAGGRISAIAAAYGPQHMGRFDNSHLSCK